MMIIEKTYYHKLLFLRLVMVADIGNLSQKFLAHLSFFILSFSSFSSDVLSLFLNYNSNLCLRKFDF